MNSKPQSGQSRATAQRPSPKATAAKGTAKGSAPETQSRVSIKQLSERGQAVLHRLLDEGMRTDWIPDVVWLQTREVVSEQAITRYASRYRKRQQEQQRIRETLDGILERAHREGITTSDLLRAALLEKLSQSQRNGTLKKMDLLALETVERKRGEYELKQRQAQWSAEFRERELRLKERQTRIAEKRFRLIRDKAKASLETLEEKASAGGRLSADDLRKIREIYGLYEDGGEQQNHG